MIDTWLTGIAEAMGRVGRRAVSAGLVVATGGNLSVRPSPSDDGHGASVFVVTRRGALLDELTAEDLTVMRLDGDVVAGPEPSSEWRLHQRSYLARPDAGAVVHLHPAYTVLLDALGKPVRLLTLDHIAYVGTVARVPFWPNGSDELADAAAEALTSVIEVPGGGRRRCDCVVLAFHGCSTVGATLDDAFRAAVNLESAATATHRMLLLGDESTQFPPHLRATALHGRG